MNELFDYTVADEMIETCGARPRFFVSILRKAQEHYGELPAQLFPYVAEKVGLTADNLDRALVSSCGKCTPCREGVKCMQEVLQRAVKDNGADKGDVDTLLELADVMVSTSFCFVGKTAAGPVEGVEITDKCIGCTKCARACPVGAIAGKVKEKHNIDQTKCIKCGACFANCPVKAIKEG